MEYELTARYKRWLKKLTPAERLHLREALVDAFDPERMDHATGFPRSGGRIKLLRGTGGVWEVRTCRLTDQATAFTW